MAESLVNVTEGAGKKLHTVSRSVSGNTVEDDVAIVGEHSLSTYTVTTLAGGVSGVANDHALQLMAGASLNVLLRYLRVSQIAPIAAAIFLELQLVRLTTAGSGGTVLTPRPMVTTDPAVGLTAMTVPTAKGTEGAIVWSDGAMLTQTIPTAGGPAKLLEWDFDKLRVKPPTILAGAANGFALKILQSSGAGKLAISAILDEANYTP